MVNKLEIQDVDKPKRKAESKPCLLGNLPKLNRYNVRLKLDKLSILSVITLLADPTV